MLRFEPFWFGETTKKVYI